MYQEAQKTKPKIQDRDFNVTKKKIISTWRYPGVSKIGEPIPIPEDVLGALQEEGLEV